MQSLELRQKFIDYFKSKDHRFQPSSSIVIKDDRPFHPRRLWDVCHNYLDKEIYRSKGFFWLASNTFSFNCFGNFNWFNNYFVNKI